MTSKARQNLVIAVLLFGVILPIAACVKPRKPKPNTDAPLPVLINALPHVESVAAVPPVMTDVQAKLYAIADALATKFVAWGKSMEDAPEVPAIRVEANRLAEPAASLNVAVVAMRAALTANADAMAQRDTRLAEQAEAIAALEQQLEDEREARRRDNESQYTWIPIGLMAIGGFGIPIAVVTWFITRDGKAASVVMMGAGACILAGSLLRVWDETLVEWGWLLRLGLVVILVGSTGAIAVYVVRRVYQTKLERAGASVAKLIKEQKPTEAVAVLRQAVPEVDRAFVAAKKGKA